MVYCTRCGVNNPDEAEFCTNCGARLEVSREERWERREKRDPGCFGLRWGGREWGLFWGVIIVLAGTVWLLERYIPAISWGNIWPIVVIAFGILVIASALSRRRT
ncbi:MAG: zinc-ribbon domain-containing protein [Candidatus Bathyarchaeia archaeon]